MSTESDRPLSARGELFLRSSCLVSPSVRESSESGPTLDLGVQVRDVRLDLRGVVLPILGGDLAGWFCLAAGISGRWRSPDGLELVRLGQHRDLQAAVVMAGDGKVGVSWAGEFLPRYSSVTHFVEAAAAWLAIHGWILADFVRSNPADVLEVLDDCEVLDEASGEFVAWWIGVDCAVYCEPRVTESPGALKNVLVFTRDESTRLAVSKGLRARVPGARPEDLLLRSGPVGVKQAEPPRTWGILGSCAGLLDDLSR